MLFTLLIFYSFTTVFVGAEHTDILVLITHTQKEPYIVFTYPNSEESHCVHVRKWRTTQFFFELIPVMFQPQTWQASVRLQITTKCSEFSFPPIHNFMPHTEHTQNLHLSRCIITTVRKMDCHNHRHHSADRARTKDWLFFTKWFY